MFIYREFMLPTLISSYTGRSPAQLKELSARNNETVSQINELLVPCLVSGKQLLSATCPPFHKLFGQFMPRDWLRADFHRWWHEQSHR